MQRYSFYVGLDLGQAVDYTAIAIIEAPLWVASDVAAADVHLPDAGWQSPAALSPYQVGIAREYEVQYGRPARPVLALRHLERLPLGTPYPAVVERVMRLLESEPLRGRAPVLVVDHTGVGRGIVDLFRQRTELVAITITGGDAVSRDGDSIRVPKRDLIAAISVLLEGRRLQIAESLPEAQTLVKELSGFQRRVTPTGHDQYAAWREGQHDDLVLAVALAGWYREWWNAHLDAAATVQAGVFDYRRGVWRS
jgi:hypothetical protein